MENDSRAIRNDAQEQHLFKDGIFQVHMINNACLPQNFEFDARLCMCRQLLGHFSVSAHSAQLSQHSKLVCYDFKSEIDLL